MSITKEELRNALTAIATAEHDVDATIVQFAHDMALQVFKERGVPLQSMDQRSLFSLSVLLKFLIDHVRDEYEGTRGNPDDLMPGSEMQKPDEDISKASSHLGEKRDRATD